MAADYLTKKLGKQKFEYCMLLTKQGHVININSPEAKGSVGNKYPSRHAATTATAVARATAAAGGGAAGSAGGAAAQPHRAALLLLLLMLLLVLLALLVEVRLRVLEARSPLFVMSKRASSPLAISAESSLASPSTPRCGSSTTRASVESSPPKTSPLTSLSVSTGYTRTRPTRCVSGRPTPLGGSATRGAGSGGAATGGANSRGAASPSGGGAVGDPAGGLGAGQPPQPDLLETLSPQAIRVWIVRQGSPSGGRYSPAGAGAASLGGTTGAGGTGGTAGGAGGAVGAGGTRGAAGAGGAGATSPRGATGVGGAGPSSPGGTAGAGGAGGAAGSGGAGAGGTRDAGAAGPGGARTESTGAAGAGGAVSGEGAGGTGAAGTGGAGATGAGAAGAAGPRGARSRGTGAAGAGGAASAGGATGAAGTGGAGATAGGAAGAGGAGGTAGPAGTQGIGGTAVARGAGATGARGAAGARGATEAAGARGAGASGAGGAGAAGTAPRRLFFYPQPQSSLPPPDSVLCQVLSLPSSTSLTPPLLCPPTGQSQSQLLPGSPLPTPAPRTQVTESLTERREPETRASTLVRAQRVACPRPPAVPGSHGMTLRPSSVPQHVVLPEPPASSLPHVPDPESDLARAASPTFSRLLAIVVTDPDLESTAAFSLVTELVDFAARSRLDYVASLVTESDSCLAAALPPFASMLLCPEGDPDALDIPTLRSFAKAITGEYSSRWETTMDAEMASWKPTGTYIDDVPPPGANIDDGMWIFRGQEVDFFHTFSPTPKMTTLWVLLYVEAQRDYEVHSFDFSIAFLQGSLYEEIWLCRPPGFTGSFPAGTKWSLRRPVYVLRKAPREWHDTLRTTLAALGFAPSSADPSLFLRTDTTLPSFYVLVYVDDLVFATADTEALSLVKAELQERHTCTDLVHWAWGSCLEDGVQWYSYDTPTLLGPTTSCETEIYAGAMAAQELRWLTYLLTDLGERPRSPPVLYVDNKAMLALCHEQRLEHRTKHIALRYFLARELLQHCELRLSYVASRANTADVFTKALGSGDHQRFCAALGLVPTLPHLVVA
ncbi:unnamed protein product [Closterium sp. NIES-53]